MHKRKRKDLENALSDLKNEFWHNRQDMTEKQREIVRRNIKSIEKVIDNLFFTF